MQVHQTLITQKDEKNKNKIRLSKLHLKCCKECTDEPGYKDRVHETSRL